MSTEAATTASVGQEQGGTYIRARIGGPRLARQGAEWQSRTP